MSWDLRSFGAVPFWFWNGEQVEDELASQMQFGAAWGLRGFAIHGRYGNQTEYLSERWFALVRFCCEKAIELGLEIWIYDEDGYPSGTVGDRIPTMRPDYRQQYLWFECTTALQARVGANTVRVFSLDDPSEPLDLAVLPDDARVLAFSIRYWDRYIDTLNPEVVETFISMTHDRYEQELGEYFGNPITHFYTDDVGFHHLHQGLAYTGSLEQIFSQTYGYSLLDHLPALVLDLPGCEKIRMDYRRLVTNLFCSTFQERLYNWCEARGLKATGHLFNDEGDIGKIVNSVGSTMQFYAREHLPGIDDFFMRMPDGAYAHKLRNANGVIPITLYKQVSSVANQLKGGHCSAEVLTYLGWGVSLVEQQLLLNLAHLLGINVFSQHAFYYTVGGIAKRDCPPSYFFQQPYWDLTSAFQAKLARSTRLLTRGTYKADVLIMHPISSAWVLHNGSDIRRDFTIPADTVDLSPKSSTGIELEDVFASISLKLLQNRISFEYGDEEILLEWAFVSNGYLQVGDMRYKTVLVPPVVNLYESTVKLLQEFSLAGGDLIFIDPPKRLFIDGSLWDYPVVGSGDNTLFPHARVVDSCSALLTSLPADIELEGDDLLEVMVHTRVVEDRCEYFLVNLSPEYRTVSVTTPGNWAIYDPETDKTLYCGADWPEGFALPPWGCCHILPYECVGKVIPEPQPEALGRSLFRLSSVQQHQEVIKDWGIHRARENICVLDYCCVSEVGHLLLRQLGELPKMPETIMVEFEALTDTVTHLMGENLDQYSLWLNGKSIGVDHTLTHPSNKEFQLAPIGGAVEKGLNTLVVSLGDWQGRVEDFHLLGEFAVCLKKQEEKWYPAILPVVNPALGDLVTQGLPFYWGSVVYEKSITIDKVTGEEWLDLGEVQGAVELYVNDAKTAVRMYPPYRFYLGDVLKVGTNRISLRLFNTAQNLYGPHRNLAIMESVVPPGDEHATLHDSYSLMPFGVYGPVVLTR